MNNDKKDEFMNSSLSVDRKAPGFFRDVWQQIRLVYYLIRDPEVPFYLKFLPFVALVYLVWPFDIIPDIMPFLGQVDDVTAVLVGAKVFIELAPPHVVARHMNAIREQDGFAPYEDVDDEVSEAIIIDPDYEVSKPGKEADQA
jgi:uncharacterized membrane protein YkvA (DUF1232 family)